MDALGHDPVGLGHLGDLREHVALAVRLGPAAPGCLQLPGMLLHRGELVVGPALGPRLERGAAPGGLLRVGHGVASPFKVRGR